MFRKEPVHPTRLPSVQRQPHCIPTPLPYHNNVMSDSSSVTINKLRRVYPGTGRPSNIDIIDDAWVSDKLSDDEVEVERSEAAIAPLLEDEGELDDTVVTTANSGSAASGALERRRKVEGRWNDLGLDLFDNGGSGAAAGTSTSGGGGQS